MKRKAKSLRKLPTMRSDRRAARFVADADLTRYDLTAMRPLQFEFAPKEARVNMRLPGELLEAVKAAAQRQGVPYQRFIRQALERALRGGLASDALGLGLQPSTRGMNRLVL